MRVVFAKKAFEDQAKELFQKTDKFALQAFNRLAHDWEISSLLVANFLLSLSDHYTPLCRVKLINFESFVRMV